MLSGCWQKKSVIRLTFAAVSLLAFSARPASANNILPGAWDSITTTGAVGTLRAGSGWELGASLGAQSSIVDGLFLPEQTQWNSGSWWWDQDPSVNPDPVVTTIHLNQLFTIDGFTVQADNNDVYRLEYWTGSAWQAAWDASFVSGFGLMTRTSGLLPAFSTDQLRLTVIAGDNFYSVSEIQASGAPTVPEPTTLLLLCSGLIGIGARRGRTRGQSTT